MDPSTVAAINEAVQASQRSLLSNLGELVDGKLSGFERKISEAQREISDKQLLKIQQDVLCSEPHKFSRKSCEDQFKFNQKLKSKFLEAEHLSHTDIPESQVKISEGIHMLDYRQKLIKLADTSESGWKAVEEYQANPIASDSDDEKKMDRARARANRKMKAASRSKGRGRGRHWPYDTLHREARSSEQQHQQQQPKSREPPLRPGTCYACGRTGHWRSECPTVQGAMATTAGQAKLSTNLNVESEVVNDYPNYVDTVNSVVETPQRESVLGVSGEGHGDGNAVDKGQEISPVGRLKGCFGYGKSNGTCQNILSVISDGYKIPFKDIPSRVWLSNNKSSRDNPVFVQAEIEKLIRLGCVSISSVQPEVVNPLTVAYSKSGKPRLVLDCRHVNLFLHKFKFKYENSVVAREMFTTGDFLYTFDLKSAYHHIEIWPGHRKFLGFAFMVDGKRQFYTFNVLPFGIATAGYIFTKVLREVVKHVRGRGYNLIMYLDDGIGGHRTEGGANAASKYVRQCLNDYGFIIAHDKCQWEASQQVTWLGYTWSMAEGVVRVTRDRLERILSLLSITVYRVCQQGCLLFSARYVAGIVGQLISMQSIVGSLARLRTRALYACLLSRASWNARVRLSVDALDEIEFWGLNLRLLNEKGSVIKANSICSTLICSDASATGFGGFIEDDVSIPLEGCDVGATAYVPSSSCDNSSLALCAISPMEGCDQKDSYESRESGLSTQFSSGPLEDLISNGASVSTHTQSGNQGKFPVFKATSDHKFVLGSWDSSEQNKSSTWRELEAAKRVLFSVGDELKGQDVKLCMDNKNACSIANVGSRRPDLQKTAWEMYEFCSGRNINLHTQWIPRCDNQGADYLSRCTDSDDWSVQYWVFKMCDNLWGPHQIDRFADTDNRKCRRFNSRWWCVDTNGVDAFTFSWEGVNNWLVPPPRLLCQCIVKLRGDLAQGTLIVPHWESAAFWPMLRSDSNFVNFVVDYRSLGRMNITSPGKGNNGCFGKSVLSFEMLALRLDCCKRH